MEHPNDEATKQIQKLMRKNQKKAIRLQIIWSSLFILVTIVIICCLVNFTNFKYNSNILNNFEFNVLCCVIIVQGLLNLLFLIDFNVLKILEKVLCQYSAQDGNKIVLFYSILKSITSFGFLFLVLSPLISGVVVMQINSAPSMFLVINNIKQDSIEITTIKMQTNHLPGNLHSFDGNWTASALSLQDKNDDEILKCKSSSQTNKILIVDREECSVNCFFRKPQSLGTPLWKQIFNILNSPWKRPMGPCSWVLWESPTMFGQIR